MPQTFYDEQARHRRATWRWTILAALAVMVMALPLSLVLTPLVYLVLLVALHLIDRAFPVAASVWSAVDRMAALIPTTFETYQTSPRDLVNVVGPLALALLVPGAVTILIVWVAVKRLLESVGVEATLRALGARPPQESILEEQQFRHLVEEMAVAAGIRAPDVRITEHLSPNMALVGSGVDRAALVVSRRLLNACDRAETQALVGHLIASLVNGDLAIGVRIESVHLTGSALNALVNAPFGPSGRRVIAALVRALVRRAKPEQATKGLEMLIQEWAAPSNDLTRFLERDTMRPPNVWRQFLHLLLLPLYLLHMAVLITAGLLEAGLVGPILTTVLRARRSLADAGAVELTRNPTQLARALHNIGGALGDPRWAPARLHTVVAGEAAGPMHSSAALTNTHPRPDKRIKRLAAQGAVLSWEPRAAPARSKFLFLQALGAIIVFPLLALLAYLIVVIVALVTVLAMGAMAFTLALIHAVFQLLQ